MTEACVVESTTIVVDSHRTVCYFVAAIAINISHSEVVVALTSIACPLRIVGVEDPTTGEILSIPIPSSNHGTCIISTTEESRRSFTIEISHTCKITLRTIAMVVAPTSKWSATWNIVNSLHSFACKTVEDSKIFRALHDSAQAIALLVAAPIFRAIANDIAFAIDGAIGCLHHEFSFAIAIEVVSHKLSVVGSCTDILSHVDTPQTCAVKLQAIEINIARVASMRIIMRV